MSEVSMDSDVIDLAKLESKPNWATHTFKNASGTNVWFNKEAGQAQRFDGGEVVKLTSHHYAHTICKAINS